MMKSIFASALIATMVASTAVPSAAIARNHGHNSWQKKHQNRTYQRGYEHGRKDSGYRNGKRGYYGNANCKRDKGTGGLIIGALAGGLLGNQIAGDKTLGTIVGGGVGALAGQAIDKSDSRC